MSLLLFLNADNDCTTGCNLLQIWAPTAAQLAKPTNGGALGDDPNAAAHERVAAVSRVAHDLEDLSLRPSATESVERVGQPILVETPREPEGPAAGERRGDEGGPQGLAIRSVWFLWLPLIMPWVL